MLLGDLQKEKISTKVRKRTECETKFNGIISVDADISNADSKSNKTLSKDDPDTELNNPTDATDETERVLRNDTEDGDIDSVCSDGYLPNDDGYLPGSYLNVPESL